MLIEEVLTTYTIILDVKRAYGTGRRCRAYMIHSLSFMK